MNGLALRRWTSSPFLRLGRVSNLPTVWSNVLAGSLLAGADPARPGLAWQLLLATFAISAFYEGGMYLNDAFDHAIDARERPTRPIPAGEIGARQVFRIGFALLLLGIAALASQGAAAAAVGAALGASILVYDRWHKGHRFSPLVMGLCRAWVYLAAAAVAAGAAGLADARVAWGALAVFAHVVGLTYAARQESLDRVGRLWPLLVLALPLAIGLAWLARADAAGAGWWTAAACLFGLAAADAWALRWLVRRAARGDVGRAVALLIAATALLDAAAIATTGAGIGWVAAALAAFGLTRALQRVIPGT